MRPRSASVFAEQTLLKEHTKIAPAICNDHDVDQNLLTLFYRQVDDPVGWMQKLAIVMDAERFQFGQSAAPKPECLETFESCRDFFQQLIGSIEAICSALR